MDKVKEIKAAFESEVKIAANFDDSTKASCIGRTDERY